MSVIVTGRSIVAHEEGTFRDILALGQWITVSVGTPHLATFGPHHLCVVTTHARADAGIVGIVIDLIVPTLDTMFHIDCVL